MEPTFLLECTEDVRDSRSVANVKLDLLVQYCDRTLRTRDVRDYDGAINGLQVANHGSVRRIAAAVDASLATVEKAAAAGAHLLVVDHGLFWGPRQPWTGHTYALMRRLLEADLAVYSSHLPLDQHPRLGNNALLCQALGLNLRQARPFFFQKEAYLGLQATVRMMRDEVGRRLEKAVGGRVTVLPGGPAICRKIGIVSGGAGAEVRVAAAEGVDTFVTGEGPHWTFGLAEELGINVLYGGHYATETFGVKALAAELSRKFRVPWTFVDHPSGL